MKRSKKTCKGFSLLELLLSIAIISLIILMATRYFTTVRSSQQITAAAQFVQGVRSAASAAASAGQTPTAASLCTNKNVPASYCNTGNTALVSPWETPATGASTITATGTQITVVVAGLPGDAATCTNLANVFPAGDATATCAPDNKSITIAFP